MQSYVTGVRDGNSSKVREIRSKAPSLRGHIEVWTSSIQLQLNWPQLSYKSPLLLVKNNNSKLYFSLYKYLVSYPNSNEAILMPCNFSYGRPFHPKNTIAIQHMSGQRLRVQGRTSSFELVAQLNHSRSLNMHIRNSWLCFVKGDCCQESKMQCKFFVSSESEEHKMPLSTILNGINPIWYEHETRDQESQSSLIYKHPGGIFIAINEEP